MIKRIAITSFILCVLGGGLLVWTLFQEQSTQTSHTLSLFSHNSDPNGLTATPSARWPEMAIDSNEKLQDGLVELHTKSPQDQQAEQQARLLADMNKLAAGQIVDEAVASKLYGENWQRAVEAHRQHTEQQETLLTIAVVIFGIGGLTFAICVLIGFLRLCTRMVHAIRHPSKAPVKEELVEKPTAPSRLKDVLHNVEEVPVIDNPLPERDTVKSVRPQVPTRSKVRVDVTKPDETIPDPEESPDYHRVYPSYEEPSLGKFPSSDKHMANMLTDEDPEALILTASPRPILEMDQDDKEMAETAKPLRVQAPDAVQPSAQSTAAVEAPAPTSSTAEPTLDSELSNKTADLERQIAQVAQQSQVATEGTDPMNGTLMQLSEQISAIRQYASNQQDRVEKLQSGYDWNIIRTFCLRVIRCIDNIETRMERMEDHEEESQQLSEVHDELLFALESSGVEQFEPEMNSVFRGQERLAEAVKDKEACSTPELKGCIAQVIKPGYQYLIDDETEKIVRTARVKLYG